MTGSDDTVAVAKGWLADAAALDPLRWTSWSADAAGRRVRFRCLQPEIAECWKGRIVPRHTAEADPREPDLDFALVETRTLGWPDPGHAADWERNPAADDAALAGARLTVVAREARGPRAPFPWVVFDPATGRGLLLVRTLDDLPDWRGGAPYSFLFHTAAAWRGQRLVHAGSLGLDGRGALLMGASGVGKSGTTLAAVLGGLQTVGDDYLHVTLEPEPAAHAIYRMVKQDRDGLRRLGGAAEKLRKRPLSAEEKVEFDPEEIAPGCRAQRLELDAILLPVAARGPSTRLVPMAPTEAFACLGAETLLALPGGRVAGFRFLTRLTRALPSYRLHLSEEPQEIAETLASFCEEAAP